MQVKIIKQGSPEKLESEVNLFLEKIQNLISIEFNVGAFPGYAEFYAMIIFDK